MSDEPKITINGVTLTTAQAMTVRVAIESFATDLQSLDALGDDETGRQIRDGYLRGIRGVRAAIFKESGR